MEKLRIFRLRGTRRLRRTPTRVCLPSAKRAVEIVAPNFFGTCEELECLRSASAAQRRHPSFEPKVEFAERKKELPDRDSEAASSAPREKDSFERTRQTARAVVASDAACLLPREETNGGACGSACARVQGRVHWKEKIGLRGKKSYFLSFSWPLLLSRLHKSCS